jgi:hypothetical protein
MCRLLNERRVYLCKAFSFTECYHVLWRSYADLRECLLSQCGVLLLTIYRARSCVWIRTGGKKLWVFPKIEFWILVLSIEADAVRERR